MQRLRIEEIMTVGFVDKGDDPEAEIVFFKSKGKPEKEISNVHKLITAMAEKLGFAKEQVEELLAEGAEDGSGNDGGPNKNGESQMTFDVNKLDDEQRAAYDAAVDAAVKARLAEDSTEGEKVLPEMSAPVQKVFDDLAKQVKDADARATAAEDRITAMEDQKQREVYIQKATELGLPGAPADDFADILRKAQEALSDEERAKMDEILQGASKAIKEGDLLKEVGSGGSGPTDSEAEMKTIAKGFMETDPKLTQEMAEAKAWDQNPALYAQYQRERPTRNRSED